jgi:putative redox protein
MEALIEHLREVQFQIKIRNHTLVSDQPESNGGYDEGPTPPEFLLASLGSCAAYYAAEYLKARKLSTEGLRVHVSAEKAKAPARLAKFQIDIEVAGPLEPRHYEGLHRAAEACLIHATLTHPPEIRIAIHSDTAPERAAA